MLIYVINLAHRKDRMARIGARLSELGLPFTRINAVDGRGEDDITYPPNHALTKPEYACYLSHIKVLKAFLASNARHCLILEDDLELSSKLPDFLSHAAFLPPQSAILRLEAPTMEHWGRLAITLPKPVQKANGYSVFRLLTSAYGSGAQIMPRALARRIVEEFATPRVQVDIFLYHNWFFNRPRFKILQTSPALARQWQYNDLSPVQDSDIVPSRATQKQNRKMRGSAADIASDMANNFRQNLIQSTFWLGRILRFPFKSFPFEG